MKKINSNGIYIAFIFFAFGLQGCRQTEEYSISNAYHAHVPEKVQLLEYSSKSITVAWDFIDGATSYTVQLMDSPTDENPLYTYTTSKEDYYEFTGLNARDSYYARVRANFPYSSTSTWNYIINAINPARIIPRYGIVADNFEIPYIKLINSSSSTLTLEWSFTDFEDMDSEIDLSYTVALYKDPACTDLAISWEDVKGIFAKSSSSLAKPLRFTFSGLTAASSYYAKILNSSSNLTSNVLEVKTAMAQPLATTLPNKAGDIVISQEFNNFIHGGDLAFTAGGYSVTTAAGRSTWQIAQGKNPINADLGQSICDMTTEFNVFDGGNVTIDYTKGVGMENWGKNGNTSTRPGYIKIGGNSALGALYTPLLNYKGTSQSVEVKFRVAPYSEGNTSYAETIVIDAVEGANFSAKGAISNASSVTKKSSKTVTLMGSLNKFEEYTVQLDNITPNSRIVFSSDPNAVTSNKTRFLLDNITVTLK